MKKNTYNTKVRNTSHFIPTHTYNTYTIYQTSKILLNNINISYSIKTHILSIQFTLLKSYTNPIVSRSYRLDLSFFEEERGASLQLFYTFCIQLNRSKLIKSGIFEYLYCVYKNLFRPTRDPCFLVLSERHDGTSDSNR